jgi:hypothetical protein
MGRAKKRGRPHRGYFGRFRVPAILKVASEPCVISDEIDSVPATWVAAIDMFWTRSAIAAPLYSQEVPSSGKVSTFCECGFIW